MDLSLLLIAAAAPGVLIAGIAKGGFGGTGAFAAVPILSLSMEAGDAAGVMLPLLMVMDALALRAYWGRWSWIDARAIMVGLAAGTAIGWVVFGLLSPAAMKLAIGLVALVFVGFQLAQRLGWRPSGGSEFRRLRAWGWSTVSGVTSFVAHAGGPPVAMTLVPRRLDKTAYQATITISFAFVNALKLGPYAQLGLIDLDNLTLSAALAPLAALGILIGVWSHARVSQRVFERVVVLGIAAAGAKLVWDGLAGL